jgi:hypothetical protein
VGPIAIVRLGVWGHQRGGEREARIRLTDWTIQRPAGSGLLK